MCRRFAWVTGHREAVREQVVARVTGANFDEVALAAEGVNGLEEKYFGVGHGDKGKGKREKEVMRWKRFRTGRLRQSGRRGAGGRLAAGVAPGALRGRAGGAESS